jgi:hypothetical protein
MENSGKQNPGRTQDKRQHASPHQRTLTNSAAAKDQAKSAAGERPLPELGKDGVDRASAPESPETWEQPRTPG